MKRRMLILAALTFLLGSTLQIPLTDPIQVGMTPLIDSIKAYS